MPSEDRASALTAGEKTSLTPGDGPSLTAEAVFAAEEPFGVFADWLRAAEARELNDPNAMSLATVGPDGMPNVRIVLLKGFDAQGFVFYTNLESAKGEELAAAGKAALCFHWKSLRRQVRVRGTIERVSDAEADAYYASRPRLSRIGAWASRQSRPLDERATLERRVKDLEAEYDGRDIPRPPHWSGTRVMPDTVEFWQDGAFRLHDRCVFTRADDGWRTTRLYP